MKRISLFLIAVMVMMTVTADAGAKRFSAKLTGDQQVPPTISIGSANINFTINTKYGGLYYEINVSNLDNIVSSHIHIAPAGSEGPVAAVLLSGVPTRGGRSNGRVHVGVIMPADLVGPFDSASTLDPLLSAIRAGRAYACIHTRNGSTQESSGNFPDGEVRGQIR